MADGAITVSVTLDDKQAEKELLSLQKKIADLKRELNEAQVESARANDRALRLQQKADAEYARLDDMLANKSRYTTQQISEQKQITKEVFSEYDAAQKTADRYNETLATAPEKIKKMEEQAAQLVRQMNTANENTSKLGPAFEKAGAQIKKVLNRIGKLILATFVFRVISAALRRLRDYFSSVLQQNEQYVASVGELKGTFYTLANTILNDVSPALIFLLDYLNGVLESILSIVAAIKGTTVQALREEASAMYDTAKAAKKASGALAGFDEINRLSFNQEEEIKVDFGTTGEDAKQLSGDLQDIQMGLSAVLAGGGTIAAAAATTLTGGIGGIVAAIIGLAGLLRGVDWDAEWKQFTEDWFNIFNSGDPVLRGGTIRRILWGDENRDFWHWLVEDIFASDVDYLNENLFFPIRDFFVGMWTSVSAWFQQADQDVTAFFDKIKQDIVDWWVNPTIQWVQDIADSDFFKKEWWDGLFFGIGTWISGAWSSITGAFDGVLTSLKNVWRSISDWWKKNVAPVFSLIWWADLFSSIGTWISRALKTALNGVISVINFFIDKINEGMSFSWDAVSIFGNEIIPAGGFTLFTLPKIPKLAQGAVIPPNREFMAVLGDQTSGNNIEAPEALLRQMAQEAAGANTQILRDILAAVRAGKVMAVDRQVFARLTYDMNKEQSTARGASLVTVSG